MQPHTNSSDNATPVLCTPPSRITRVVFVQASPEDRGNIPLPDLLRTYYKTNLHMFPTVLRMPPFPQTSHAHLLSFHIRCHPPLLLLAQTPVMHAYLVSN